ncbi:hypothetical protein ABTJ07_18920, partial [Acinetobacter baumannii]
PWGPGGLRQRSGCLRPVPGGASGEAGTRARRAGSQAGGSEPPAGHARPLPSEGNLPRPPWGTGPGPCGGRGGGTSPHPVGQAPRGHGL